MAKFWLVFELQWPIQGLLRIQVTAPKKKLSIKDFFSKCYQIRHFLRIWPHLLKKSLTENLVFCTLGYIVFPGMNELNHFAFTKFADDEIAKKILLTVKSVQIRSFSGLYFPAFGLNTKFNFQISVFSPNARK